MKQQINLKCPHCGKEEIKKIGHSNNKQRYQCQNPECHKTFYFEYTYNAYKPGVRSAIIGWSVDGAGIRAIARELGISTDTVISELKKRKFVKQHQCGIF
jgi:transposase-like protein